MGWGGIVIMNKELIAYINETLSFTDEWEGIFGHPPNIGNVFCPFHVNKDTPAAKVYGNKLHCFSCQRNYSVYDLLKRFAPERIKEITRERMTRQTFPGTGVRSNQIQPVLNDGVLINVLRRIIETNAIDQSGINRKR